MSITLKNRQIGDVTVIDASGRITLGDGANALCAGIANAAANEHRKILLNLRDISYIDSSGIGELVFGFTNVKNSGGQLKLVAVPARLKNLLQMTNLHTLFEMFDDEGDAVRSFG